MLRAVAGVLCLSTVSAFPFVRGAFPPLNDTWHNAPPGFEDSSPGTILRSRTPPSTLVAFGIIPLNLKSAHQIQYRTTNSQGEPEAAITAVFVLSIANYSRLVSYQDFEDSAWVNCVPSYALQDGTSHNTTLSQANILFEAGLREKGYIVSIPDYEGPQSAFGAGP